MFTIAIVGNKKTGKTSLFNYLTKTNFSIINDKCNYSFDFNYACSKFRNNKIIYIDIYSIKKLNFIKSNKKLLYIKKFIFIIKNVNFVFFLVNAQLITDKDFFLSKILLNLNKNIILLVNKIDLCKKINLNINNFRFLSISKIYFISIFYKKTIIYLLEDLFKIKYFYKKKYFFLKRILNCCVNIYNYKDFLIEKYINDIFIKVILLGKSNVGKSTLLNLICNNYRVYISKRLFTTKNFVISILNNDNATYLFSDSFGLNNKNIFFLYSNNLLKLIKYFFNIILYIIDINIGISKYDLWVLNFLLNKGKYIILVFNKCKFNKNIDYKKYKKYFIKKYDFMKYIDIYFFEIIIDKGKNLNLISKLLKKIFLNYKSIFLSNINNSLLNNILKLFNKKNIFLYKKKIKLKYSYIVKYNPLIIIIYGKNINLINNSYKKYLLNFYMNNLKLKGCKIFLKFKEIYNPYFIKK